MIIVAILVIIVNNNSHNHHIFKKKSIHGAVCTSNGNSQQIEKCLSFFVRFFFAWFQLQMICWYVQRGKLAEIERE